MQQGKTFFVYRIIALVAIFCAALLELHAVRMADGMAAIGLAVTPTIPLGEQPRTVVSPPVITAHAYFVQILGDAQPLAEQRADKQLPPASLTKILTAVVSMEELTPDAVIVFSPDAKNVEEKTSPAKAGDGFLRDDMIRLMLIDSANDAARALAEAVGRKRGGRTFDEAVSIFELVMNQKAAEIGMDSSSFQNPNGLDAEHHLMSARDLYRLMQFTFDRYPQIWEMTRTIETPISTVMGQVYQAHTTDELLPEFPALAGGKTGFTDNAGQSLILLYRLGNGKVAAVVLLRSQDRFEDGRKVIHWLEENYGSIR